ncbi:MAG: isoprenylcysteine carboxylmethyltransferase family protein [Vicinamibacterales bacterium]
MSVAAIIAVGMLAAVLAVMAGEAVLSSFNASVLRSRGAVEPPDDVYRTMQWAYPLGFVALAIEGALRGPSPEPALAAGILVFGLAKALKAWAISSLGTRWTFRVLVPPGDRLVASGPYRFLRHPNYLAVAGEIVGAALLVGAFGTGALFLAGFGWLMRQRIAVEERALGRG